MEGAKELRKEFNSTWFKNELRKRYGEHTCYGCGKDSEYVEFHHIVPLVLGGDNTITNIVPLCYSCHKKAHGSTTVSEIHGPVGGRKKKKPPKGYENVLDRYVHCEIGHDEAKLSLGMTTNQKLPDKWWYKEYLKENNIKKIKNLVDNNNGFVNDPLGGKLKGFVIKNDGTKIEYYTKKKF